MEPDSIDRLERFNCKSRSGDLRLRRRGGVRFCHSKAPRVRVFSANEVKGFRGTMSVHPGTGNVLFHGGPPQSAYQGRYSPGPPPQVVLLTVTGGVSSEAEIVCQLR
jgi:hypothetical protein